MAMSSTDGAKALFLNDYNIKFFQKRFPQTLTGGLRFKIGAQWYIYFYQIFVFLFPALFGVLFTILAELEIFNDYVWSYIYGGLLGVTLAFVHLLKFYMMKCPDKERPEISKHNLPTENEIKFSSCWNKEIFWFMFPKNSCVILRILAIVLSSGATFLYLQPSVLEDLGFNRHSTIILLIFNWLTLCIANYSLTVYPPPETAMFRTVNNSWYSSLTRSLYVGSIAVVGVLARHYSSLKMISMVLCVVMATLPGLWTVGILPPIDALFPWLGEQVLVFVLGGTYTTSDVRLCFTFVLSVVAFVPACFITNHTLLISYSAAVGFILSFDLWYVGHSAVTFLTRANEKLSLSHLMIVVKYTTMLFLCVATAGVSSHFGNNANRKTLDIFGYVFVFLFVLLKILGDLNCVYVASGLVRNPIYIKSVTSVEKLKEFQRSQRYVGVVYDIVHCYVCPFLMVAFLSTFLGNLSNRDIGSFLKVIGIIRSLRWAWQNTFKCLFEIVIYCVVIFMNIEKKWWHDLGIGLQLLLIGIIIDRLVEIITKLKFMFTVFVTSWIEPKQRHSLTIPTYMTSLVLSPLVLGILVLSVLLSSPLTPLFCFPIFFVGFPRPKRAWPSLIMQMLGSSEGSIYYQQLMPKLVNQLRSMFSYGNLTSKSDFLLIRYQDRLLIVQILEKGYKYCNVIVRGLELQETSCHTVEAAQVDEIFEDTFTRERNSLFGFNLNHWLNTLTPLNCFVINTYSDAHSVLTGIIDQAANISQQCINFMKCLIWVLLKYKTSDKDCNNIKTSHLRENIMTLETDPVISLNDNHSIPKTTETSRDFKTDPVISLNDNHSIPKTTETLCDFKTKNNTKLKGIEPKAPEKTTMTDVDDWYDREWSSSDVSESEEEESTKIQMSYSTGNETLITFGLPAQDIGSQTKLQKNAVKKSNLILPTRKIAPKVISNLSDDAEIKGGLLSHWNCLLRSCQRYVQEIESYFPKEWFSYVLNSCDDSSLNDEISVAMYRNLILNCFSVVNVCGLHGNVLEAGPSHINKVFHNKIPWSPELDMMEKDNKLKNLVLKAYRYAFKVTYDEAVFGEFHDDNELNKMLQDYELNWHIGIENNQDWNAAILAEKAYLFTIGYDSEQSVFTSHLLTKQDLIMYIGTLNSEAVRGQWSSLAFELLYLTNDDEERYSIQAHPVLLRNVTMQAAEPPLGYAVYSSGPLHITF